MSKLTEQWIELFRAGDHGEKGNFTEDDLDQIVANYQPHTGHEAPVTIGHPESDAPAYGWFGELKRQGKLLLGKLSQVQPEFEDMVEKRLFPKRSVGLAQYSNAGWTLHHVAFLGAQAPQIKGLADCKFEQSSSVIEVEFQESSMANETKDGVLAWLNTWFEEKFGTKGITTITPKTFSEDDVKRIATEAVASAVKPLQESLDTQKQQFAEREKALNTTEATARAQAAITKVKASGHWIPAFDKMGLGAVFGELAKTTETVEFGEGDAKKKLTPLDTLVSFMEQLQKIVPAGADIYAGHVVKPAAGAVRFSEENGKADQNSVTLANLSEERARAKGVTYAVAMNQILTERPELAIPGGATAGAV